MLQTHLIAELLDMEAYDFEGMEQSESRVVLKVRMKRRTQECPACKTPCDQVHDYRIQRVKDSPIQGKLVIWQYRRDDIVARVAGNDSTKGTTYCQSGIESPTDWRHMESINYRRNAREKRSRFLSASRNRQFVVG